MNLKLNYLLNLFSEDASWNSPKIENLPLETNITGRDNIGKFLTEIDEYEEFLATEEVQKAIEPDKFKFETLRMLTEFTQ